MALLFTESCDDVLAMGWTTATQFPVAQTDRYTGDTAGSAWAKTINGTGGAFDFQFNKTLAVADEHATAILGFAWNAVPSGGGTLSVGARYKIARFKNSAAAATRATLWLNCLSAAPGARSFALELRVGTGSGGTLLTTSTIAVVDSASWYYIECKYTVSATVGTVEIRVNGSAVATASGIDTTGGQTGTTIGGMDVVISTDSLTSWGVNDIDDIYMCNGAGANNNSFLGDVRVVKLRPNGAGASTSFVPGGTSPNGSNFENVNNVVAQLPGSPPWNASGVAAATDYYAMADLPASAVGTVFGLVRKTAVWCSALNVGVATLVHDGVAESESATVALTTTVAADPATSVYVHPSDTDASGGAWTPTKVNNMQAGIRVKTIT